jgi:ABC-type polysaccharide/polyol phosphate transport system ATPase subunit
MKKNIPQINTAPSVISVKNVSKMFFVPHERISTLRGAFVNMFKKKNHDVLHTLKDVSFDIKKGEFFGIIGRNGSGKSTLLKIISGVYTADKGSIKVNGDISPFLELGIGFNPELSGRDNVYLNATVLGLTEKEINEKFDSIVAFSEIERFIDQKIKNYSSGMQVRLAFSVAIHANRDILLLDEVLAVGDANFQSKCFTEFHRYRREGKTIILVTHDTGVVEKYCDRAVLLRNGAIGAIGNPMEVVKQYREQNMSDSNASSAPIISEDKKAPIPVEGEIQKPMIGEVVFLDPAFGSRNVFQTGGDLIVRVYFKLPKNFKEKFNFKVSIFNEIDQYMFGVNTILDKVDCSSFLKNGYFEIAYHNLPLRTGIYYAKVGIIGEHDTLIYDFLDKSPSFRIFSDNENQGSVDIDYQWVL